MGVAARLARRELTRRPGRSVLVALLVALPVAALVVATVLIRTDPESPMETWQGRFGTADASIGLFEPSFGMPPLPAGARVVEVEARFEQLEPAGGEVEYVELSDHPLDDPITDGTWRITAGTAPRRAGDIAVSEFLAQRVGVEVGDQLRLERPRATTLDVVGIVEPARCVRCSHGLVAPGTMATVVGEEATNGRTLLVDLQGADPAALAAIDTDRFDLSVRPDLISAINPSFVVAVDANENLAQWSYVVGAMVLAVAGTVITSAFAVSTRRQLVTLGQLAAAGTPPATLRRSMAAQGAFTGLLGTAMGLGMAAIALLVGPDRVEHFLDRPFDGYSVEPRDILVIAALGTTTASVAAWLPSRGATRVPPLLALAGRRPPRRASRRSSLVGALLVVGGLGLMGWAVFVETRTGHLNVLLVPAMVGAVCQLIGAWCLAPTVVAGCEPLVSRVRGSWRLALRALVRHRTRTAAIVAGTCAAGALAVGVASVAASAEAERDRLVFELGDDLVVTRGMRERVGPDSYELSTTPVDPAITAAIEAELPGSTTIRLTSATQPELDTQGRWTYRHPDEGASDSLLGILSSPGPMVYDEAAAELVGLPAAAVEALDDGKVVIAGNARGWYTPRRNTSPFGGLPTFDGPIDQPLPTTVTLPDGSTTEAVIVTFESNALVDNSGDLFIGEAGLRRLQLETRPLLTVHRATGPLNDAQRSRIEDVYRDELAGDEPNPMDVRSTFVAWHEPAADGLDVPQALTAVASLFTLLVVGAGLALHAAESKDERALLAVVGAAPSTVARSAAVRAWTIAVLGTAMAVPVGMLPVLVVGRAVQAALDVPVAVAFPVESVVLLVGVTPLAAAVVAWAASSLALRARPVRVSTMAFE